MPKTYYNAQVYPEHALVHIPQAAIEAGLPDKVLQLIQIVYGSERTVSHRKVSPGRKAARTSWARRYLHCGPETLLRVIGDAKEWIKVSHVKVQGARSKVFVHWLLEPTLPVIHFETHNPRLLTLVSAWHAKEIKIMQSYHADSTMYCDYQGSQEGIQEIMADRMHDHLQGLPCEISTPGRQTTGRLTTIYACMEKAERRKLVDLTSREPIISIDIRTTQPAMLAAMLCDDYEGVHCSWAQELRTLVAKEDIYAKSLQWLASALWTERWAGQLGTLRSWAKQVFAAWLSRTYRQDNAKYAVPEDSSDLEVEYKAWARKNRCDYEHEEMYDAYVRSCEAQMPRLAAWLDSAYAGAKKTMDKPWFIATAWEVKITRRAWRYYRLICQGSRETPVWSTVYDCALTRESHTDLALQAMAWSMNHYGVQTGLTIEGGTGRSLTTDEVLAYGVGPSLKEAQYMQANVVNEEGDFAESHVVEIARLLAGLGALGYKVGIRAYILSKTQGETPPFSYTHEYLLYWWARTVKPGRGGYRLQIKGILNAEARSHGALLSNAIRSVAKRVNIPEHVIEGTPVQEPENPYTMFEFADDDPVGDIILEGEEEPWVEAVEEIV